MINKHGIFLVNELSVRFNMPSFHSKIFGALILKGAASQWVAQETLFRPIIPYYTKQQSTPNVVWIPPKFIPSEKLLQAQRRPHRIEDDEIVGTASVYVKNTSQANGSGHVSISLRDKNGQVNHVSFGPGAGNVGSLIAGISVGLLPVIGVNHEDPLSDAHEAEAILQKKLNQKEFNEIKGRMIEFKNQVKAGQTTYAVTASFSTAPVDMLNEAIRYFTISQVSKTNQAIFGHELGGGFIDLPQPMTTYNCITAVAKTLGYDDLSTFARIPNNVIDALIKAGYTAKDIGEDVKLKLETKT